MSNLINKVFRNASLDMRIKEGTEIKKGDFFSIKNKRVVGDKTILHKCNYATESHVYAIIISEKSPYGMYRRIKKEYLKLEASSSLFNATGMDHNSKSKLRKKGVKLYTNSVFMNGGIMKEDVNVLGFDRIKKDESIALLKTIVKYKRKK